MSADRYARGVPREASIVNAISRHLVDRGVYHVKTHGSEYGEAGTPDLFLCHRGRFLGLEVKQPGEKPRRIQQHRLEQIRRAGGIGECVRSVEDVEDLLCKIDEEVR